MVLPIVWAAAAIAGTIGTIYFKGQSSAYEDVAENQAVISPTVRNTSVGLGTLAVGGLAAYMLLKK